MDQPESGPSRIGPVDSSPPRETGSIEPNFQETSVDGIRSPGGGDKGKRKADGIHRPKNLQACDRCRTKKTKDVCQACNTASLTCTFDMPLTASRTKRIRRGMTQPYSTPVGSTSRASRVPRDEEADEDAEHDTYERRISAEVRQFSPPRVPRPRRSLGLAPARPSSFRREGPTAMSYILHSTPTLPIAYLTEYDQDHNMSMRISPPNSGDGYMMITTESHPPPSPDPPVHVIEALHSPSWPELVSRLVETYLAHVSPLIPIVTRDDVGQAHATLCHAMAAVAAARRNCPKEIFDCLNFVVQQEVMEQDILSDPTRQNVQTLLVLCLVDELALQPGSVAPENVARNRLAAAIRMAQDLLMDRGDSETQVGRDDMRIWQCAVVIDQWNATRTGARPIIPFSTMNNTNGSLPAVLSSVENPFFTNLTSLSMLLAELLAKVYGPDGVKKTKNEEVNAIRDKLKIWKENLSSSLKFNGIWSGLPAAGLLHLLHTTVLILLYRPFMRWSFICPAHLDLSLDIPAWMDINPATHQVLEWATNQDELADMLFFGPYALSLCGLVQYHSYARRREWDGVVMLEKFNRDGVERWIKGMGSGHLPVQRAQLSVISLLYAAAQTTASTGKTSFDSLTMPRGLDPTPGVLNRLPETSIQGVTFLRDPTHPQGGVLVATQKAAREIKDLPPGTVIIGGPPPPDEEQNDIAAQVGGGMAHSAGLEGGVQPASAGYDALASSAGYGASTMGGDGRISMSTPDWEAIVTAFNYPSMEAIPQTLAGPQ
ncbi:hypothetical protein I316_03449 [Kwoniella heveanensis BCC8398]|uniref:Zn(2)-C6 fungal-type domain-containing protein n=1 Tax=Kwoniella heveanensis BCC8398 TaxID=1296120 RepID=A0A1B9GV77_9TREE|nr:hypothetical protein I316_03449 [Kwoniella heveanensis BCC8398]